MSGEGPIVLFVCEHGSAKSTIAAAHFNNIARERNLTARAISRGTDPDETYPPNVTAGLGRDGLHAEESRPKKLSDADFATAGHVVVFNQQPSVQSNNSVIHDWSDVPAVSEGYDVARDEILERVKSMLHELRPA
jgi:arsenate reductase (thioredoxin)